MSACNHDCLNCIYDDCVNDDAPTASESADIFNGKRTRRITKDIVYKDSDTVRQSKQRWLDNHKEYMREYQKKYRAAHKEKAAAYQKEYRRKYRTSCKQSENIGE